MENGSDLIDDEIRYALCTSVVFKITTTTCLDKRMEKYDIAEICHYFRGIMLDVHSGILQKRIRQSGFAIFQHF